MTGQHRFYEYLSFSTGINNSILVYLILIFTVIFCVFTVITSVDFDSEYFVLYGEFFVLYGYCLVRTLGLK